jgi:DNA-binding NtrC family response regulator
MSITLIAKDDVLIEQVGEILKSEGAGPLAAVGMHEFLNDGRTVVGADPLFFVSTTQELLSVGEAVSRIHERIGDEQELVVCVTPSPFKDQRQHLVRYGASDVISPTGTQAGLIAERILAHLILRRRVEPYQLGQVLGATAAMREVYEQVGKYAPLDFAVLLRGETGTGKGMIAKVLHVESGRVGEFIHVDSTTLNSGTIESDLFGHTKGSFTGAHANKRGMIEAAHEGTVFIDEIGDLELSLQGKLLDVIENNRVRAIGANRYRDVDVRFICATHQDLERLVREGKFRRDLFARMEVLPIKLPPLRQRKADIPLLVEHFINEFNGKSKSPVKLEGGAIDELFGCDWPLNVRGLSSAVYRSAAGAGSDGAITNFTLSEADREPAGQRSDDASGTTVDVIEINPLTVSWPALQDRVREAYFRLLAEVADNEDHAVDMSQICRSQLYVRLREFGLHLRGERPPRQTRGKWGGGPPAQ